MTNHDRRSPNTATIRREHLLPIEALTKNQEKAIKGWSKDKNLVLSGSSGTGKTYLALHLALNTLFDKSNDFEKIVLVRSIVPTRDIGFLPGDENEKEQAYMKPYISLTAQITGVNSAWNMLLQAKKLEFESTSFLRGITLDNTLIIGDECQNMNSHELDTLITRIGVNSRIIFCGDYYQSDLKKDTEKRGVLDFFEILYHMQSFEMVEFRSEDIVRSDLVRDYIMTKEMLLKRKNNDG